jgi:mannose-1-phosphate guanylyltransferase
MKLIIFAGGIGTRLWPLSRENAPKQFDKIFKGKSTLQLAVGRVKKKFGIKNIYIQTVENFVKEVREQIPDLPKDNIIIEPNRRNLAPAVCLATLYLKNQNYHGSMALLWADHLMKRPEEFVSALGTGEKLIDKDPERFVFLGEKPRFDNNNLGWVHVGSKVGKVNGHTHYKFEGWKYKPEAQVCKEMFKSGEWYWNPGYFITSVKFLYSQYEDLASHILEKVQAGKYSEAEKTSFDRAIVEKVNLNNAVVIKTNMEWSDPGTLYALKEALETEKNDIISQGEVVSLNSEDCLLYNFEKKKILAGVGLNGMVVVNTEDALVVVPKDEVVNITALVKKLREEGKNEYL